MSELFRTNKPKQQNNTYWLSTAGNLGKTEDHTPRQTRILTEKLELKENDKLKPQDDTESRNKFFNRVDWTDTQLTKAEKQAIEDIVVYYHYTFAKHRMDIGMNTEFRVQLNPKDDEAF